MKARNDDNQHPPEQIDPYEDARMQGLCEEGAEEVVGTPTPPSRSAD